MSLPRGTDDAVAWLLGDGHISLLDTAGRPLGERASPLYPSCPREERTVSFGDLRDPTGLPANIAALRQVAGYLNHNLGAFSSLYGSHPSDHARLRARAEAMCLAAPLSALRINEDDARVAVDERHASAFKLCLGFREMQNEALLQGRDDAEAPVQIDVVMERLATEPLLVGDAQVCAGSTKQIELVLRALLEEPTEERLPAAWRLLREPWFEVAVSSVTTLHDLAALAASTALALFEQGVDDDDGAVSSTLATCARGPRVSQALRARTDGAPLRVTLLHRPDAVPEPVRAMVEAIAARLNRVPLPSLTQLDAILLEHARPVADALMQSLGRESAPPLRLQAFRAACGP
ncbi:MAG: hypothetical protein AB8I08_08810 [Sandaracinaceae bacterium]